ncbi:MAG: 4-hydroxythreonine-4-phosphate dehydrogenase PdxA, partial [Desulforhopalus sp.]
MTIIGITMGCPVSIGPEIILRYFSTRENQADLFPVVLGDKEILEWCGRELNIPSPCVSWSPGTPLPERGIPVVELSSLPYNALLWGKPTPMTGRAMAGYIESGVQLVQQGVLDGLTTCPISKASLNEAGYQFPGHTEML